MSDDRWIDGPPQGAEGWRRVWRENLAYRVTEPASMLRRAVRAWVQRLVRSASREEAERQRNFNLALLEMLDDARRDFKSLHNDLSTIGRDLTALAVELREFRELGVQRNDALVAAVDQKIETIAVRIRDLTNRALTIPPTRERRDDFLYRRLEEGMRGSAKEVRENLRHYLSYAERSAPVIDVGCGRGEFLELCRESSIKACGFDTNERSVSDLRERGFQAEVRGIPECFDDLEESSVGSIMAAHVVEHLPASLLFEFFSGASRVLRSGGFLMIETPNAESVMMSATDFWRDPTHIGPRHAAALTLLGREFGFEVAELRAVHEFPQDRDFRSEPGTQKLAEQLNATLFAPQDLRLVLRKI